MSSRYEPLQVVDQRVHLSDLDLDLAVWHGMFADEDAPWLRWHLLGGPPVPTELERADAAAALADAAGERADAAERRAEALAARLAELERRLGEPPR